MNEWLSEIEWKYKFAFSCYGEKLGFRTDDENLKFGLQKILPPVNQPADYKDVSDIMSLVINKDTEKNGLYFNDELAMEIVEFDEALLEFIGDKILNVLAQISLPGKFYLHAGAVSINGSGILFPGLSYAGKTTLTKEFLKAGAEYLSDDCIILDDKGCLLPFPRDLAVRTENGERVFRSAEHFGTKNAADKVKLKLIIYTQFDREAEWNPRTVSQGKGVLELMNNFFYRSSVGLMPQKIIKSLTEITSDVGMFESERNEAETVIEWAKNYLENKTVKLAKN